jgi:hypothetical protein
MPTLSIKPALISKKSVLVISWPYKANWDLLNSLSNGCYLNGQDDHPQGPQTVLLFSLYKFLEFKLDGNALDASRSKFATIGVNSQRGQAILTLETEPTFSAVRKVLTLVSKNFTPSKLMSLYKKFCGLLGMKVDSGEFAWCVEEMIKGIKTLAVFVTGTIRVPDGKLDDLKKIVQSITPDKYDAKSSVPKQSSNKSLATWDEITCASRLEAFLIQQLLSSMQIESHVRDGNVIPITGSSKWETVKNKIDGDRIDRLVEQKIIKLGDKLTDTMRLLCARTGYFSATELDKLPSNYTAANLKSILKKHF